MIKRLLSLVTAFVAFCCIANAQAFQRNDYDDNGYPKTKNVLAKTKKECVEKLQKLKEECGGLKPEKVRPEMLFGDWLTYWYENHSKPKIRPTTQETYEDVYKRQHFARTPGAIESRLQRLGKM